MSSILGNQEGGDLKDEFGVIRRDAGDSGQAKNKVAHSTLAKA